MLEPIARTVVSSAHSRWAQQHWTPGHCNPLPCWTAVVAAAVAPAATAAIAVHLDPTLLPPLSPSRQTPQVVSTCFLWSRGNSVLASRQSETIGAGTQLSYLLSQSWPAPAINPVLTRTLPARVRSLVSSSVLVALCLPSWADTELPDPLSSPACYPWDSGLRNIINALLGKGLVLRLQRWAAPFQER